VTAYRLRLLTAVLLLLDMCAAAFLRGPWPNVLAAGLLSAWAVLMVAHE
jgi:hypothetical protein